MSDPSSSAQVVEALTEVPDRLVALLGGLDEASLRARPTPDGWSALEVLAHLRASEAIVAPRLYQIVVRDEPALVAFDERRWAEVAGYADLPASLLLQGYAARRAELVAMLRRLAPGDWERAGLHEIAGRVTLLDIARSMAEHEAEHIAQLQAMLSR
jgi:DinB family protein